MESRSSHSTNARWVVVNTQPHRESLALKNLEQQKFSSYCPMIRKTVRHARKSREVLRPLFPGYLFVQVDPNVQRWRPLLSTYGVRSIVGSGEQLSFLDTAFIESLKAREIEGVIERPRQPYRIGQEVKLAGGAFEGLVATIIDMDEKDRLVVLLDLLNRPVKVKLHAGGVSEA
jgi:transcriptional antiterminator RfaH